MRKRKEEERAAGRDGGRGQRGLQRCWERIGIDGGGEEKAREEQQVAQARGNRMRSLIGLGVADERPPERATSRRKHPEGPAIGAARPRRSCRITRITRLAPVTPIVGVTAGSCRQSAGGAHSSPVAPPRVEGEAEGPRCPQASPDAERQAAQDRRRASRGRWRLFLPVTPARRARWFRRLCTKDSAPQPSIVAARSWWSPVHSSLAVAR